MYEKEITEKKKGFFNSIWNNLTNGSCSGPLTGLCQNIDIETSLSKKTKEGERNTFTNLLRTALTDGSCCGQFTLNSNPKKTCHQDKLKYKRTENNNTNSFKHQTV